MLISYSRKFKLLRNLLFILVFVICLVSMFQLAGDSIQVSNYIIGNNNPSFSATYYQQLSRKIDFALFAQKSENEDSSSKRLFYFERTATNASGREFSKISRRLSSDLYKRTHLFLEPNKDKKFCPIFSPKLIGWTNISVEDFLTDKDDVVERKIVENGVEPGGKYKTKECQSQHKVAIVVPLRNRTEHLKVFLRYMHPLLQRQQLDYAIIVVEQTEGSLFNRGMLMNIGFVEAQLLDNFRCFIFHDVDVLPENDGNPYTCPEDGMPRQMSFSLDFWNNYKPTPAWHFGGVTALTADDFREINGFSNVYWGWGGEDDDLLLRVKVNKMAPTRAFHDNPSLVHLTRYKTLTHKKAEPNPIRHKLLSEGIKRFKSDGLRDLKYKRLDLELKPLYTRVYVELQQPINPTTSAEHP